jgi:hypothetical protein
MNQPEDSLYELSLNDVKYHSSYDAAKIVGGENGDDTNQQSRGMIASNQMPLIS